MSQSSKSESLVKTLQNQQCNKTQPTVKQALLLFNSLPEQDRIDFIKHILSNNPSQTSNTFNSAQTSDLIHSIRFHDGVYCIHCGSTHIVKRGHSAQNKQRYLCRDCKHSFQATSKTTLEYTKKTVDTWIKYIECVGHQFSIRKSAFICGISVPTSFFWRHKILDLLRVHQNNLNEKLKGIVEADETFFHLSFKGTRNLQFYTTRKAHRRGNGVNKRGLSKEQVCVPCAVSTWGKALSQVGKLGKVSLDALAMTLGGKIEPNTVLCSDKASSYIQFCERFHLTHNNSRLKHVAKLLKIHDPHIQHINAYHSGLKVFMTPFKGVATKYLNNYLCWYNRKRDIEYSLNKYIEKIVFSYNWTNRRDWISIKPSIPVVA